MHGLEDIEENLKDKMTRNKNSQPLTTCIILKDFSGISSILPRISVCVGGYECSPQSLTAYSLKLYSQC